MELTHRDALAALAVVGVALSLARRSDASEGRVRPTLLAATYLTVAAGTSWLMVMTSVVPATSTPIIVEKMVSIVPVGFISACSDGAKKTLKTAGEDE